MGVVVLLGGVVGVWMEESWRCSQMRDQKPWR